MDDFGQGPAGVMSDQPTRLDGPRSGPASGGAAKQLIVLLHGLGADGNDLISLAPILDQVLPDAAFVSPHAPFPCDMAPFGRQWFSLQERSPEAMYAGAERARGSLVAFLEQELAQHGLGPRQLALVGFSQGTMMSLHTALRMTEPVAAIVGFSGLLIAPERLKDEIAVRPPVLLVHGSADEVVPALSMPAAELALSELSVPVKSLLCPGLGHSIDEEGLRAGLRFLMEGFSAAAPGGPEATARDSGPPSSS